MTRETLRKHLRNLPLEQAIRQKAEVDETRKALNAAWTIMEKAGVSDAALDEVNDKVREYSTVSKNYGNMIEDTWHITWQMESIIKKYIDHDLDELPEIARF